MLPWRVLRRFLPWRVLRRFLPWRVLRLSSRGGCHAFPPVAGATPFPNGANALFIGHSFFVPISRSFDEIALSSGAFPQHRHQEVFSGGKSGTPRELWDSQQKRAAVTAILADGDIDLPGLTPGAARLSWDAQDVNRLVTEVAAQNAAYN